MHALNGACGAPFGRSTMAAMPRIAACLLFVFAVTPTAIGAPVPRDVELVATNVAIAPVIDNLSDERVEVPREQRYFVSSADGRRVVFKTLDVWPRGWLKMRTEDGRVVSLTGDTPGNVTFSRISPDGRRVVFSTDQALGPGDTDETYSLYRWTDGVGVRYLGANPWAPCGVSADASTVVFTSTARLDPADIDDTADVYVVGETARLLTPGDHHAHCLRASSAMDRVLVETAESLVVGDGDDLEDAYEIDVATGAATLRTPGAAAAVSVASASPDLDAFVYDEVDAADLTRTTFYKHRSAPRRLIGSGSRELMSMKVAFSPDGRRLALMQAASDLQRFTVLLGDGELRSYERPAGQLLYWTTEDLTAVYGAVDIGSPDPDQTGWWVLRDGPPLTIHAGESASRLVAGRVAISTQRSLDPADTDEAYDVYEIPLTGAPRILTPGVEQDVGLSFNRGEREPVAFGTAEPLDPADTDSAHDMYERVGDDWRVLTGPGGTIDFAAGFATDDSSRYWYVAGGALYESRWRAPTVASLTLGVGRPLRCDATATGDGVTVARRWLRDGAPIAGADGATYALTAGDSGHAIACAVSARNAIGEVTARTAPYRAATPAATLTLPPAARRNRIRAWRTLRGTVVGDAAVPGLEVRVGLVRRLSAACRVLVAGGFRTETCARATTISVPAMVSGSTWSLRIPALRRGTYQLVVRATDGAGGRQDPPIARTLRLRRL